MKRSIVCVLVSAFLLMTGCHAEGRPPDGTDDRAPAPESAGETDLQRQEAQQVDRFDAVQVDVLAANIQVIPGETWSVAYALSEKELLERFGVEDGTLYVETRFDEKEHFDHREDYYVVMTVPEGASLTELELDTLSLRRCEGKGYGSRGAGAPFYLWGDHGLRPVRRESQRGDSVR